MKPVNKPMKWAAIAPFFCEPNSFWLDRFVTSPHHQITNIPRPNTKLVSWHNRRSATTSAFEWMNMYRHVQKAWSSSAEGIITVFPQLAAIAGSRKRLCRSRRPIVAWCVNIGQLYSGPRRALTQLSYESIDCFVVHSRRECDNYSSWYNLPRNRFEFVPLQRGYIEPTIAENMESPFILSMGSAHRDYRTLFEAIRPLGIRTIVVASPRCLNGLDVPDCVEFRTGLTQAECTKLTQQARLIVVPISNDATASGQVTVIDSMWLGRAVIATHCIGTEDYITSETDGCLVPFAQVEPLREGIKKLWTDHELRSRLGRNARQKAIACFSDEMAGKALSDILDRFYINRASER